MKLIKVTNKQSASLQKMDSAKDVFCKALPKKFKSNIKDTYWPLLPQSYEKVSACKVLIISKIKKTFR